ncbi:Tetratricopeptide repeat-containing protein [Shimia gijangensis]|uniref:Tetratricopeptide repeat-containing protein n=1 Tax=Shimia gijangensis TaxID=1470563 RepID=A0A1M6FF18_9RHOB|nr:tetratricopeptide repeat protein [Shimia gijangensis]SHI96239.1 Tetratricopeptide repeat-containing protein [Shimia gijangensis]
MATSLIRKLSLSLLLATTALPVQAEGLSGAYLAARQATINSDYNAAARYYTRALAGDPSNPVILESAVLSYLSLGQLDTALPVARKIVNDGLKSQLANMVVSAGQIKQGDYVDLLKALEEGEVIGPLVDGLMTAWAHIGNGNMSLALEAFDKVAEEPGLGGFAAYHKALALASVGDYESAEAIYSGDNNGAIQSTRRGVMALVEILSQLDRNADALALLDSVFDGHLDPDLASLKARLESGESLPYTHIHSASDGMAEVFYSLGSALEAEASPDYTLLYTRIAQYLRPDHFEALLLTAGLLEQLERYELATEAYKSVPADHPSYYAAELGRAEALRRDDNPEAAIEVLEQLARSHGDLAIVHSSLGDLLRQQRNFEAAVEAYDRALEISNASDRSLWFHYYARGICHERLDHWEQSEADFRKALELNPEQPQVLNYLGYSLVEKQTKLDEALEMIERAVAARPESGYIVDSLGWVLYRLGRYDEAVDHMERAAELMPVDPVVNDHLGDVYWAVGRILEAEFQWRRALSFVDEETEEEAKPDRIRRKLEIGLDQVLEEEGADPLKVANDG